MAVKCEMCGSPDLVKDGEFFECKNCGCKYTVAEIKKQMGIVTVIENQDNKKVSLMKKAETEYDATEYNKAIETYNKVLEIDPEEPIALCRASLCNVMIGSVINYELNESIIPYYERAKTSLLSGKYPNYPYKETLAKISEELLNHIVFLSSYIHDTYVRHRNITSVEAEAILRTIPVVEELADYLDSNYCTEFWPDHDAVETSIICKRSVILVTEDLTKELYYSDYVDQYGKPANIDSFAPDYEVRKGLEATIASEKEHLEEKEAELKAVEFVEQYDGDLSSYYQDIESKFEKIDKEMKSLEKGITEQDNIMEQNYGAVFGKKAKLREAATKEKNELIKKKNSINSQHVELEAFVRVLKVKLGMIPYPAEMLAAVRAGATPDEALSLAGTNTNEGNKEVVEESGPKALLIDDLLVCQGCDFVMDNPDPDIKTCPQCGLEVVKA